MWDGESAVICKNTHSQKAGRGRGGGGLMALRPVGLRGCGRLCGDKPRWEVKLVPLHWFSNWGAHLPLSDVLPLRSNIFLSWTHCAGITDKQRQTQEKWVREYLNTKTAWSALGLSTLFYLLVYFVITLFCHWYSLSLSSLLFLILLILSATTMYTVSFRLLSGFLCFYSFDFLFLPVYFCSQVVNTPFASTLSFISVSCLHSVNS